MMLVSAVSCGTLGCQRFQSGLAQQPLALSSLPTTAPPTHYPTQAASTSNAFVQTTTPVGGAANKLIVRGQDGANGFELPPLDDTPADGSRHTREPLPVSGQPSATVAQNPPPGYPNLPAPLPSGAGVAQELPPPPGGAAYDYETLPQITDESLNAGGQIGQPFAYTPLTRTADIIVNGFPARTGRIMFGGAVNSDAGVNGQITIEERNFDITRFPGSFQDLVSGTAFRGAGQTFRLEAVPGNLFKRYTVNFTEPFLFGYLPISLSVSGFLFDRRYQDWDEERLGGRLSLGYRITPDLSISGGIRGERVKVRQPRIATVDELNEVLGENEIYSWQTQLTHDTRNSPFAPSEGHYFEVTYEQAFGDYDFARTELSFNRYFLVRQRADRSGRQTLTMGMNAGFSGNDTPIFENFFAGGYTTLRGFEFRGASPTQDTVQVGGRFKFLGTVEYMFPLTADDMLRGVVFVDYGTVERDIEMNAENFRVAPGFGLRVAVPALGPAPLAFDFAFPVAEADGDEKQAFSFFMGLSRRM